VRTGFRENLSSKAKESEGWFIDRGVMVDRYNGDLHLV
jgi:hypothetical protein